MSPCETCPNLMCSVCCPCQLLDEPVWAIGTGLVCPSAVAQEVRTHISMQYVYVSTWRGVHTDTLCTWVRTTAHILFLFHDEVETSTWLCVWMCVNVLALSDSNVHACVCQFVVFKSIYHPVLYTTYLSALISFDCPASCSPISLYFATRHFAPL